MSRFFKITLVLAFLTSLTVEGTGLDYQTGSRTTPPTIESLEPRGISRGSTQILIIEGYNLRGTSTVYFSESAVRGHVLKVDNMPDIPEPERLGGGGLPSSLDLGPQPKRYQVHVEINIDKTANIGPVGFRLVTAFGLSPVGKILVEPEYPIIAENDFEIATDGGFDVPKKSSLPTILTGVISEPGDEDFFAITVQEGESLIFEESGTSIGSKIQPVVDLLSIDHALIHREHKPGKSKRQVFSHHFKKTGTYLVRVGDYTKTGSKDHFYRIKIGDYPLVKSAYPLGLEYNKTAEIKLNGFNLEKKKITVSGAPLHQDDDTLLIRPKTSRGNSFNSVKLALGNYREVEAFGNNVTVESAQEVTFPVTINGRITADPHYFRFMAEKGQLILIEVTAAQMGSSLDSVIDVVNIDGKPVGLATLRAVAVGYTDFSDHTSEQAEIRLLAANQASGDIDVGDYLMLGSEVTRITRMPRQPDEGIAVEAFPPVIPGRQTGQTRRIALFGTSPQAHALGTATYKVQVHPPGKDFPSNGLPLVRLYHHNDDGGVGRGKDSFLRFRAPTKGEYLVKIRDTHGRGGDDYAYRLTLRPRNENFALTAEPRAPNIPIGERVPLRVTAFRKDGFDGDIHITVDDLPQGIQAADTVIPAGQMVATLMLYAQENAVTGMAFPLKIRGVAEINGSISYRNANPTDRLQFVSVTAPADILVTTNRRKITLEPGQDAKIEVSVLRKNGFTGRVPVEVLNLPPNTDTPEVGLNRILITEGKKSQTFSIRALPNAKPIEQLIYVSGIIETRSSQPTAFTAEPILLRIVKKMGFATTHE